MNRRLFFNEFIGSKTKLASLVCIMISIYILIALTTTFLNPRQDYIDYADYEINGKRIATDMTYTFEMFQDITPVFHLLESNEYKDFFEVYPCIERFYLSIDQSALKKVQIQMYAFQDQYFKNHVKELLLEGRLPQNPYEIVIGSGFRGYFDVKLGDKLGKSVLRDILFNLSLEQSGEFEGVQEYEIVGITDSKAYEYSILREYDEQYEPNHLKIYYKSTKSADKYMEFIRQLKEMKLSKYVGEQMDYYSKKGQEKTVSVSTDLLFVVIFTSLLSLISMYILKGINRKIGILKALGIWDRRIIQIFANGFSKLMLSSLMISIVCCYIIYYFINRSVTSFYGYTITAYTYSLRTFLIQIGFVFINYITLFVTIKRRTSKVTPKDCITRI